MIEVTIDSIRVSLMSHHRIVVLKEEDGERLLPIWIGPFEAEAITIQLQGMEAARPLTHDLLKAVVESIGGEILHIVITGLEQTTFFAKIVLDMDGDLIEIDSRPSDAIALSVRANAPIYIDTDVMEDAAIQPGEEMDLSDGERAFNELEDDMEEPSPEDLGAFKDLIEELDLDNPLSTN